VLSDVRLNSWKFGRFNMSMNIVGVPYNDVHLRHVTSCLLFKHKNIY